ncbi:DUF930 domain-containing protein [Mesorhizobium neociceri]|uniref:DUF930 domain-containing protein n=1 Tax=Mesorhizobium neociceri TaxID=1307853 RepID=A0A838AXJ8_9HYPH|nr:DUF930 domain-containing protein [Mesorhizobium neociceri]MBA1138785.1 DUF930 domain-containing protein [Mesorhizobium neociceri]
MKDETSERRRTLLWALPASLILHVLIAALLVYGLPTPPEKPQEEQPVNVALVPPPDQPKPKPAPTPPEPKVEKPPEQKVEKPPVLEKPSKIEPLKPVFQFGDKDTGPRKSLDGNSAEDSAPSPAKDGDTKPPVGQKDAESKPTDTEPTQEKQATQDTGDQPLAAPGDDGDIELPASAQAPKSRPENAPKPAKVSKPGGGSASKPSSTDVATAMSRAYAGLPGVRRLYAKGATGDPFATTAMDGESRGERVATLCANVLGEELKGASFSPELLPTRTLEVGNVVVDSDAKFRATTGWYHVSFRCGIDTDATRVTSFDFRVGAAASPEENARFDQEARRLGFRVGTAQ